MDQDGRLQQQQQLLGFQQQQHDQPQQQQTNSLSAAAAAAGSHLITSSSSTFASSSSNNLISSSSSNSTTSQYVFKPILEPALVAADQNIPVATATSFLQQQLQQPPTRPPSTSAALLHSLGIVAAAGGGGNGGSGSSTGRHTPAVTSAGSVDRGLLRMRINSGGAGQQQQQQQQQPTLSVASPVSMRPRPNLAMCYRSNADAWSSAGSRHSSRPGSSASSRPPSQCGANASGPLPPLAGAAVRSASNNSSTSDVSVARQIQSLSVSSGSREQKHALFKTQKWSHSFDQGCGVSGGVSSAQTSPGGAGMGGGNGGGGGASGGVQERRRSRQPSLQQRSLDIDSGVGSLTSDLLKSSFSHDSQGSCSWSGGVGEQQQQQQGPLQQQHLQQQHVGVCSPVSSARQELFELRQEVEARSSRPLLTATLSTDVEDELSRSSSGLPSFPNSFGGQQQQQRHRHFSSNPPSVQPPLHEQQQQQFHPVMDHSGSLANLAVASCLSAASGADDQLDEEIKMYMGEEEKNQGAAPSAVDIPAIVEDSVAFAAKEEPEDEEEGCDNLLLSVPPAPNKKKDSCDSILNGVNEAVLSDLLSRQAACASASEPPPEIQDVADVIKREEEAAAAAAAAVAAAAVAAAAGEKVVVRPEPVSWHASCQVRSSHNYVFENVI